MVYNNREGKKLKLNKNEKMQILSFPKPTDKLYIGNYWGLRRKPYSTLKSLAKKGFIEYDTKTKHVKLTRKGKEM